jgi:hypothetical protein
MLLAVELLLIKLCALRGASGAAGDMEGKEDESVKVMK